jgi:hypothetical protein
MVTITFSPVNWICPFPYEGTSVHTHCGRPCHSAACALHIGHDPSPHPHDDDDDGDTVHSASQCRHPSSNPSQSLLHLMTRRTASVCGRYNKLETDAKSIKIIPYSILHFLSAKYVLFDFFLPRPSLSTTASSHATRGPLRGPPLRRRVPAGGASAPESSGSADASRGSA